MTNAVLRQMFHKLRRAGGFGDRFRPVTRPSAPGLLNHWRRPCGEDSGVDVWVFRGTDVDAVRAALGTVTDLDGWGTGCTHDCSGRSFARPARFLVQRDRTFATQFSGLDV